MALLTGGGQHAEMSETACYPNLTLSLSGGPETSTFDRLFLWSSRVWAIGTSISETIFDAGLRRAAVNQFVATYNAATMHECSARGIQCIVGGCPMMYCEPVDLGHRCMRWLLCFGGRVPG
jgi:hypothetical protein